MVGGPAAVIEEWRPVPGFPGYEASSIGRVRSVDRVVSRMHKGRLVRQPLTGKILKSALCKNGYLYVNLNVEGVARSKQVHRIVALTWLEGDGDGLDASHENGRKTDNRPSNLRWKTRKDNLADQERHGTRLKGERQNGARLTASKVFAMRSLYSSGGYSYAKLAKEFGVGLMTAYNAVTGRTWGHLHG